MLVGLTDHEADSLSQRVFWLYGNPAAKDPHDRLLDQIDDEIFRLLDFDLRKASGVKCTIRRTVARNTPYLCWLGAEGKVFGIDIRVVWADGSPDKTLKDVFLLKVFSNQVICDDDDGEQRLARTQYFCKPANNLHIQAANFPYGANEDLFAGAPILAFTHHLEQHERERKGERFVCYLMKNAGVSRGTFATDEQATVKRWSELRNEILFAPSQRIALARDLACAVIWLHKQGFQHCDLSPENVLITCASDSSATPRLALIDFDSYYTPNDGVPLLPVHKQPMFLFVGRVGFVQDGPVPQVISREFERNGRPLSPQAYVERVAASSYRIHDPRGGRRAANYVVDNDADGVHKVCLFGAPGHQHYRAPIDLLAVDEGRECYDNFALGMLIYELLCWIDIDFYGVLTKQDLIDSLSGTSPPGVSTFCGPTRFILQESILNLLKRVFSADCSGWPKPTEWVAALGSGPVYRICPGPMRTLLRRTRNQGVCLWPLPRLAGGQAGNWFRQTHPATRLKWLEKLSPQQRTKLLDDGGLSDTHKYCEVCGSPLGL